MSRRAHITLGLAALCIAFSFSPAVAQAQVRAVLIGDSQGQGIGNTGRIADKLRPLGIEVVVKDVASSRKVRQIINEGVITGALSRGGDVQLVIFIIGGNERARDRTTLPATLREAVQQANPSGSRTVVWVTPTFTTLDWLATDHQATGEIMQRELPGLNVQVIDGWALTEGMSMGRDGAHFTRDSYQQIACRLAPIIARAAGRTPPAGGECTGEPGDEETFTMAPQEGGSTPTATGVPAAERQCPEDPESLLPIKLGVSLGPVSTVLGLADYINTAYRYLVSISLIAAIVMVTYGGFRYLVGAGIDDVQKGKTIIREAIIGMVLILAAYTLLETVNPATTRFGILNPKTVACTELELSSAVAGNQCVNSAQCGEGRRCVQTTWVFESSFSAGDVAEGVAGGAALGGAAGFVAGPGAIAGAAVGGVGGIAYSYYQNIRGIYQCSDGSSGQPCGEVTDCQTGLVCNESWHLCQASTGNPKGTPCDDSAQCASGNCSLDEGQGLCRGETEILSNEAFASVGYELARLPENLRCFGNHDCQEPGSLCSGPSGTPHRFCVAGGAWVDGWTDVFTESYRTEAEQIEDGSLCFFGANTIVPTDCNGVADAHFTCMVCPASGDRLWQRLNATTDPSHTRVGSCKPSSAAGTSCSGS